MKKKKRVCVWLLKCFTVLLSIPGTIQAEEVAHLYRTSVLVSSQKPAERAQAAVTGLSEIILRVSGRPQSLQHPMVMTAIAKAQDYIYEFSYESTDETIKHNKQRVPAIRLLLTYAKPTVEQLLREAQLPMWSANRPSVLVWLVEDHSQQGQRIVSEVPVIDHLRLAMNRRGLPLVTPLLDLQDQITLSPSELWKLDEDKIRQASQRYNTDSILVGRYLKTSHGQWRATWQLLYKQDNILFDNQDPTLPTLFNGGINQVADYFADLYAIAHQTEAPHALVVHVTGIKHFGHYAGTLNYLENLDLIHRVDLLGVDGETLELHLFTQSTLSLLLDTLARDNTLQMSSTTGIVDGVSLPSNRYTPKGSPENPLSYRWTKH